MDAPFFAVLRAQLSHLGMRQRVVAENIANSTTPGFTPHDTDEKSFDKALAAVTRAHEPGRVTIATTNPNHIGGGVRAAATKVVNAPDSETTLDGNSVVLEEQMLKAAETRMAYETSLALYQKGLQLMRMAVKPPRG